VVHFEAELRGTFRSGASWYKKLFRKHFYISRIFLLLRSFLSKMMQPSVIFVV
jgi:hypothetical protein